MSSYIQNNHTITQSHTQSKAECQAIFKTITQSHNHTHKVRQNVKLYSKQSHNHTHKVRQNVKLYSKLYNIFSNYICDFFCNSLRLIKISLGKDNHAKDMTRVKFKIYYRLLAKLYYLQYSKYKL